MRERQDGMTGQETVRCSERWNDEWISLQKAGDSFDDAKHWDERAKTYTTKDSPNAYVEEFIGRSQLRDGDVVLDMGCGNGALALPLARAGHAVFACDFSAGMLGLLSQQAAAEGLAGITTVHMSWEDDWAACGLRANAVDVGFASRSISVCDLRRALLKLSSVAKRRACITISTGASPRVDERVLRAAGMAAFEPHDCVFAYALLVGEGFYPQVSYIESERCDTFATREDAVAAFEAMVERALTRPLSPQERRQAAERVRAWADENVVENDEAGRPVGRGQVQGAFRLREPRIVRWAYLTWETGGYDDEAVLR
ncbi:methyltransferase domain-containing protein [Eggerthellaceae bacterium zg-887]|nr:methyltransferase domain-containing protein [Xiamenia xianingshaonis]